MDNTSGSQPKDESSILSQTIFYKDTNYFIKSTYNFNYLLKTLRGFKKDRKKIYCCLSYINIMRLHYRTK